MKTKVNLVWTWLSEGRIVAAGVFLNIYNTEDVNAFQNFLSMPLELFDEIVERIKQAIVSTLTLCTLVTS